MEARLPPFYKIVFNYTFQGLQSHLKYNSGSQIIRLIKVDFFVFHTYGMLDTGLKTEPLTKHPSCD